jgi:pSer/pThr/pTyr-binding forkhead associated (FHA) protein
LRLDGTQEAPVIVCPRCAKENQDHYKFCLGCGAELPREAAKKDFAARPITDPPAAVAPPPVAAVAPIAAPRGTDAPRYDKNLQFAATQQGDSLSSTADHGAVASFSSAAAAAVASVPAPAPVARPVIAPVVSAAPALNNCPACGNPVPLDFKFCGTCGHRMTPGAAAPAPAAVPTQATTQATAGKLVLINPDGSEGSTFSLNDGSTTVGRNSGRLFAGDAYMSPAHATFVFSAEGCTVRDEHSLNGVYVKIGRDRPVRLGNGDVFRIGQEIVRFETIAPAQSIDGVEPMGSPNPGYLGRICLVTGRESIGHAHAIPPDGMHIGRERGDVIFPDDGYVSGLHCRVHHDGAAIVLTDVGSSNGTFLRIRGERKISSGELLLMGQQLFRLQY